MYGMLEVLDYFLFMSQKVFNYNYNYNFMSVWDQIVH